MPKSKRQKVVSLTKTTKHGFEAKEAIINEIREAVDSYSSAWVFSVQDMRNSHLKDVRAHWRTSRFFMGKNKIMAHALGRSESEEYQAGLSNLADKLNGQVGLFFTNETKKNVLKWFKNYGESEFARAGNLATESITLPAGALPGFSHSIEPHLRKIGMPTSLKRGVVTLDREFDVCHEGKPLSPEQAQMLKLLGKKLSTFEIKFTCRWTLKGGVEDI